jgi:hypothetical protein
MIVVCGEFGGPLARGTSALVVAARAAAAGAAVQAVGVVPDDPEGDKVLQGLVSAGVGHVAVLRGPVRALEAADVDLALRYLSEVRVVVTVGLDGGAVAAAAERASWAGATLIAVRWAGDGAEATGAAGGVAGELPDGTIELEAPASDPDGTFAGFVAALAARIDGGAPPAEAWTATTRALAVDPV